MVGLELIRRDRDLDIVLARFEDGFGERDVLADAVEEVLLVFDKVAVGVLAKVSCRRIL